MALITRLSRLFQADLHAVLDRIEEPDTLLRQAMREMEEALDPDAQQIKRLQLEQGQLDCPTNGGRTLIEADRGGAGCLFRIQQRRSGPQADQAQAGNTALWRVSVTQTPDIGRATSARSRPESRRIAHVWIACDRRPNCWPRPRRIPKPRVQLHPGLLGARGGCGGGLSARETAEEPVMKRPTFFEGVVVALVMSLVGSILFTVLSPTVYVVEGYCAG